MIRYNRAMAAVCLTLGALLMTATLIVMGIGATAVGSMINNLGHSSSTATTGAAPVWTPTDTPTTGDAPTLDACRAVVNATDAPAQTLRQRCIDTYGQMPVGG